MFYSRRYKNLLSGDETFEKRPLSNSAFIWPISASGSNFNPRNIQYIPVVEILTILDLVQNWTFFKGLVWWDIGTDFLVILKISNPWQFNCQSNCISIGIPYPGAFTSARCLTERVPLEHQQGVLSPWLPKRTSWSLPFSVLITVINPLWGLKLTTRSCSMAPFFPIRWQLFWPRAILGKNSAGIW